MTTTLYIKDFGSVFHYAAATKHPEVKWRRQPVTHNSARYRMLMADAKGRDAYAVFMGIVDLVVRHRSEDGSLIDDSGRPITPAVVSASTGIPIQVCVKAFERLRAEDVGWLTDRPPGDVPSTDDRRDVSPEQSRAERSRLEEINTSKAGSNSAEGASPLRSALLGVGLSMTEADVVLWHPKFNEQQVRMVIAEMADMMARGKPAKNPKWFLLTQAGMEQGRKQKAFNQILRVRSDLARLRNGT